MYDGVLAEVLGMSTVETRYEHIVLRDSVPLITGTTMKVIELVTESLAHGWSPEELSFQHPYLTMGQIHSALAYYWDHREDLDREMERRLEWADQLRNRAGDSPLRARLKAKGLL